jgi:hypothetical protein
MPHRTMSTARTATSHSRRRAPEVQIARLREFQLAHAPYWQWSPRELLLLKESLKPGDVIVPMYAHSCGIRHPNGRVTEYPRTATKETT